MFGRMSNYATFSSETWNLVFDSSDRPLRRLGKVVAHRVL
jgi:hypothetical protein